MKADVEKIPLPDHLKLVAQELLSRGHAYQRASAKDTEAVHRWKRGRPSAVQRLAANFRLTPSQVKTYLAAAGFSESEAMQWIGRRSKKKPEWYETRVPLNKMAVRELAKRKSFFLQAWRSRESLG